MVGQRGVHMQKPLTQLVPEGHTLPQPPQLEASELVLTQRPLHTDCPVGH